MNNWNQESKREGSSDSWQFCVNASMRETLRIEVNRSWVQRAVSCVLMISDKCVYNMCIILYILWKYNKTIIQIEKRDKQYLVMNAFECQLKTICAESGVVLS